MAEQTQYEYFVDLVATAPLDLLALGGNASDLGSKGFRLVGSVPLPADGQRPEGPCLLLFWERAQSAREHKDQREPSGG